MPAPFDLLRTSQPRGVVGIDRTNPLTQGLRGAWLGGAMPVDAVTRSTSVSSGGITVPSEYGLVADFTGTATTTGPTLATTTGSIVDISGSQITVAIRLRPHTANSRRVCGAHQTATNGWLMALEWPSLNMYCNGTQKTGTSISVNTWTQVAMSFDGASQKHVAKDGAVTTSSQTASFSPSGLPVLIGGYYWAGYAEFDGEIDYLYVWDRGLSPAELQILHSNPYAILAPRRILVPVSAGGGGGDVSLALTGQGGSFSQGVFTLQRETPVAGQSATFSAGLLGASLTIPLTGVSGAFAQGSVVPSVAVALIGLSATAAQGSPAASITLALTGQAGTFATGTVTASTGDGATLVGQGGTFSQGTPGVSITVALTGIAATLATGIVSAASGSATITLKAGSWLRYKKLI